MASCQHFLESGISLRRPTSASRRSAATTKVVYWSLQTWTRRRAIERIRQLKFQPLKSSADSAIWTCHCPKYGQSSPPRTYAPAMT